MLFKAISLLCRKSSFKEIKIAGMSDVKEWLDYFRFENAVFGDYFVGQLEFVHINRIYNVYSIFDEIKFIEGRSSSTKTKAAKPLRGQLKGFWHKHHFQARFVYRNICNHWGLNQKGFTKFDALWQKHAKGAGPDAVMNRTVTDKLIYEFTYTGFTERMKEGKMTGEWIIFAPYGGKNYYLTLAGHREKDAELYKRLKDNWTLSSF